jgi:hypothetical protein
MAISRSAPNNKLTKTSRLSYWIFKSSGISRLMDSKTVTNVAKNRSTFNLNVNQNQDLHINMHKFETHQKA